jgi:hypothetical protein
MSGSGNGDDQKKKDYLGRILIGFIILSGFLWLLVYLF